jgi:hypothetical protein
MNKPLMVQYGRNPPFHPTLRIFVESGYCHNQWTSQFFKPGCFPGEACVGRISLPELIEHYFSELKRCGHKIVECHNQ